MFCHWLAPRHFWLVMLGCAAGYLNAAFMPVGEYIIAHAFFWPVLFVILFANPLKPLAAGILIVSAAILLFSYESLLFLGPPLALLAAWRSSRGGEKFWVRIIFAFAAVLLVLAALIALDGIIYPQSQANLGGFKHGIKWIFTNPTWTTAWSFVWLILMGAVCLGRKIFTVRYFRLELALFAWIIVIWGLGPILHPEDVGADRQYESRPLQLMVPFALMVVAWILSVWPKWFEAQRNYLIGFSASFLLAQSLWMIAATWQWHGFVGVWRGMLATYRGPVLLKNTSFGTPSTQGQTLNFDWYWANPNLSILLAPNGKVQSIILSGVTPSWQPFDPRDPEQLPKLQRYGVNYDDYVKALRQSQ